MSVVLFPNAPSGPRACGAVLLNLPRIELRIEPHLFNGMPVEEQKAIDAEVARIHAAFDEAGRSVERLIDAIRPYRVEVSQ